MRRGTMSGLVGSTTLSRRRGDIWRSGSTEIAEVRRCAAAIPVLVLLCSTFPPDAAAAAGRLATGCARAAEGATPEQIHERIRAAIRAACDAGASADATGEVQGMFRGSIIRIPAGVYRIDGTLTMRAGVRLFGAGPTRTILYRDSAAFRNKRGTMLLVRGDRGSSSAPGPTQVSGIAFVGVEDAGCRGQDYGVNIRGCRDYRVDHCYFERFGFASVHVSGVSTGVVDHCSFLHNFKKPINNLGYGVVVYRGNLWEEDVRLGTGEATFVEDCVLVGCRHAVASNGGAHYVFRRNHVRGNVVSHAVDAHGLGYGSTRGTRCVEVYDNLIEKPGGGAWAGVAIRGGDGVIFRNVIRGYRTPVNLSLEGGAPAGERTGYPRRDQVREIYVWENDPAGVTVSRGAAGHIKKDRDYFERPRPGYEPYVYPHPLAAGGPFDPVPAAAASKRRPSSPPDPEVEKKNVEAHETAELYNAARQAERGGLDDVARTLYERLIERYPGSPLAEKAAEKLKERLGR